MTKHSPFLQHGKKAILVNCEITAHHFLISNFRRVLMLYAFFWVNPQHLNFICQHFGTLCLFHLHRRVGVTNNWGWECWGSSQTFSLINTPTFSTPFILHTHPPMKMEQTECPETLAYTRVGTLIVATIYLQLIQNRYMFRSFTVLQCSHQHCVQPVASDVEVVGKPLWLPLDS